jgi:7-cyano-7-deazaguanine synthase
MPLRKKAVVVHSGGMDSSLCLAHAIREFGHESVLSVSFSYQQRHSVELERAQKICSAWNVDHTVLDISCLSEITNNSLTQHSMEIEARPGEVPNTLVVGRNGLMARVAGIHANHLGAHVIYLGVIEVESANSGYRDCSRSYMDRMQEILQIDFADPKFEIRTPLVWMTKAETMEFGYQMGVLEFLLETTISCYRGMDREGCRNCPACHLRNEGIQEFLQKRPDFQFSYRSPRS